MQNLLSWLDHDHQSLLQLTHWLAHCDPSRNDSGCHTVLARAQRYIDAHLCIEDEILFPALEQKRKYEELRFLRSSHGRVRHAIGKLSGALINGDWQQFHIESRQLWLDLNQLDSYEQEQLHTLIREHLSEAEMDGLLQACLTVRQRAGVLMPEPLPCCRMATHPGEPICCI